MDECTDFLLQMYHRNFLYFQAMATSAEVSGPVNPLRVLQQDSFDLDHELCEVLFSKLNSAVKFFPRLSQASVELKALVQFLVLFLHSTSHQSTYGMKVLGLRHYHSNSGFHPVSKSRHLLLALLCSSNELIASYGKMYSPRRSLWRWLSLALHLGSLVNFLRFLYSPSYVSMWHRVTCVRILSDKPRSVRPLTFEFTNRELLWHTFSEFLSFLLPIIEASRFRRHFARIFGLETSARPQQSPEGFVCHMCQMEPILPHCGRCSHVFCYVCLFQLAKTEDTCPTCDTYSSPADMVPWRSI